MNIVNKPLPAEPVAIIGMACTFPQAPTARSFWANILNKVEAVSDPVEDWDAQRYLDPERDRNDRVVTARGGFLNDLYRFDPTEFGIMPNSLDGGEPDQFLALRVARDALEDAGYLTQDQDHSRTGIILGHSTYLHRGQGNLIQHGIVVDQTVELLGRLFPHLEDAQLREIRKCLKEELPIFNADIAPGLVPNVMTGRIANRLDLQGPNYIVDAACASSLLAVRAAMEELTSGRSDLMLAGGVNASLPPEVSVIFSQLGALSPRSRVRPFDAGADGTMLGEGLGVVALKRLTDALADGDRIYAVLRAIGSSSDGRAQGLLAPRLEGEILAIRRAYEIAGVEPASIRLVEAHGTGIPLGDRTEIGALTSVFDTRTGELPRVGVGSVKSQIAHCIPAAGIAGLIKAALALYHKILPPTLCDEVNPALGLERTPFYVNTEARPWIETDAEPRRAAVEAFGFGGINCHAILEEPPGEPSPAVSGAIVGGAELMLIGGSDRLALLERLKTLQRYLGSRPDVALGDVAYTCWENTRALPSGSHRFAVVATDVGDLIKKLEQARKRLEDAVQESFITRGGSFYRAEPLRGDLAFLFPGEGSQYQGMLAGLAMRFPVVRGWFDFWEGLYDERPGFTPGQVVFPPPTGLDPDLRKRLDQRLQDMDMGSEASFIAAQALYGLFGRFGVEADVMVGHSTGESSALTASGAFKSRDKEDVGRFVRSLNETYEAVRRAGKINTGTLLTVGAVPRQRVEELVAASAGQVHLAMDNCDNQLVLFGEAEPVRAVAMRLEEDGGICSTLPFDRAYHTPLFEEVSSAFADYYRRVDLGVPKIPIYSCATASRFPGSDAEVQSLASTQWSSRVCFTQTVRKMYEDGVRYFIEVGPSGNLTAFVEDILRGREHVAIQSNMRQRDDVTQFLRVLGVLYSHGRPLDLDALFQGRPVEELPLEQDASGVSVRRGLKLRNTLPMLRLSDEKVSWLRGLLSVPASTACQGNSPAAERPTIRVSGPSNEVTDEADAGRADALAVDAVMHRYQEMMQCFLRGQHDILTGALGFLEGEHLADPFLDRVIDSGAGWIEFECRLSVENDEFLRQHILSGPVSEYDPELRGLAVVPFTVSLEMMAEAARRLQGEGELFAIEDVRAYRWLALDFGDLELVLSADRRGDAKSGRIHAVVLENGTPVIEGDFLFSLIGLPQHEPLSQLADARPSRWADAELYAHGMFHGPLFQSVARVRGWSTEGIEADLNAPSLKGFFVQGETPDFVLNPVLLDALGQLSAYWISQDRGTDFNSFPSRIGRIDFINPLPARCSSLLARGRVRGGRPEHNGTCRSDYDCLDGSGKPIVFARDWEDVFFEVPNRFYRARWRPQQGWLGVPLESPQLQPPGGLAWWVAPLPEGLLDTSEAIFKRLLAHAMLSAREREAWLSLAESPARSTEWLMGRIAIKESVRQWLLKIYGRSLYPADIEVATDEFGYPFVSGLWQDEGLTAPEVSLAHSGGFCLAAASPPGSPVGVDLEWPGRLPEPGLVAGSFLAPERGFLDRLRPAEREEGVLTLWCAKEAAAKCLGLGPDGWTQEFLVDLDSLAATHASVRYGNMQLAIKLGRQSGAIVSIASYPEEYLVEHAT